MKDFLLTAKGKEYLLEEYVRKTRSTYEIAEEQGTYANKIRRALLAHGIPLRDKEHAQRAALSSGRHKHPTKGRERTEDERARISNAMRKNDTDE